MTHHCLLSALAVLALNSSHALQSTDVDTVAAQRGPFSVELDLTGTFDEPAAVEVAYRPKVYSGELVVAEAGGPGAVITGQPLIKLESEKIDEQLEQAQMDLRIARTSLARQSEETKHKEEASAIELQSAEMAFHNAEKTLATFKEVLMPMKIEEAQLGIQSTKDRLKESEEQFAQLQKMYGSDELVEETEEIVLAREKRSLEQSRKRLTFSLRRHDLFTTVDVPRELERYEFDLRKATNALDLAKVTSTLNVEKARSELEKARWKLEHQELDYQQLQSDREALTIAAPEAGMAVPGQLVRGKWTRLEETTRSLRPGEKLASNKVLFTIVQPGPTLVRTTVPEASVLDVQPGQPATIAPAASPNSAMAGKIVSVAQVSSDGNFDAWLEVDQSDPRLIAGNSCEISLTIVELPDAISVPSSSISKENGLDIVHVWANDEARAREVKVGAQSRGRTVILSGLEAGELVLQNAPKGESR